MILAGYGRVLSKHKEAWQMTCNINDGICEQVQSKGKKQSNSFGRLYDGNRLRLNSDSTIMYVTMMNIYSVLIQENILMIPI